VAAFAEARALHASEIAAAADREAALRLTHRSQAAAHVASTGARLSLRETQSGMHCVYRAAGRGGCGVGGGAGTRG
jgi:hypothetical protein